MAVLVALALPLVGYAYTGTFMRYSGDDYCYAAELFQRMTTQPECPEFLTKVAYDYLD